MNFRVEITDVADAESQSAFLHINRLNPKFAGRWLEGLLRAINRLDMFPGSHAVIAESERLGRNVRRMLYRNGKISYSVLFCITDFDDDGEDDTVHVLHVRHGAQRPFGVADDED